VLNDTGSKFCEACGRSLADPASAAGAAETSSVDEGSALDDVSPISAVTVRPGQAFDDPAAGSRAPCLQCGGEVDDDGYCTQCGSKAPDPRDHFEEQPAPWVGGVCDRGIRHHRNEDAMAMAVDGERAVLVVCDGVSNTVDSHIGSMNAARAVLDVLRPPLPRGLGVPESRSAAITQLFNDAAAAGQRAIVATVTDDVPNPPSCTLVAAVLEDDVVHYCGLGDSRIYLLPDAGDGRILTVDDSMAQLLIAGGASRAEAESSKQAHSITKWLGKDGLDIMPRVGQVEVTRPGWLLACSDGLWNYASEPEEVRAQIEAAGSSDPLEIARHLVKFANDSGGQDNIAVALARVGKNAAPDGGEPHG
jgi:serine/threonine protein phosphatase PrpC